MYNAGVNACMLPSTKQWNPSEIKREKTRFQLVARRAIHTTAAPLLREGSIHWLACEANSAQALNTSLSIRQDSNSVSAFMLHPVVENRKTSQIHRELKKYTLTNPPETKSQEHTAGITRNTDSQLVNRG